MKLFILGIAATMLWAAGSSAAIIDGYTNKLSSFPGDSVDLYLNADRSVNNFSLRLFDLHGRVVFKTKTRVFKQAIANEHPSENGYGYTLTLRLATPALASGVYLWEGKVPFIIKARDAEVTIVYPSNTVNAYCNAGGKSLYAFNSSQSTAAVKVSLLRPMPLPGHAEAFLKWMQLQHFSNVGYITDADLDDYVSIRRSKLLIIPGHNEYWTLQSRKNFDRFVHEGKNAMVLSGNTMWWQVRYDKSKTQLICYRDKKEDPVKNDKLKTILWNDRSLRYPIYTSIGADFDNGGYGLKTDSGWNGYRILKNSPLLEGTSLAAGDVLSCPSDEVDGAPVKFTNDNTPTLNYPVPGFFKAEIVGYDFVRRGEEEGVATWIVFKPTRSSGVIINTGSTDWCSDRGIGANPDIQKITTGMIERLLRNESVFTDDGTSMIVN